MVTHSLLQGVVSVGRGQYFSLRWAKIRAPRTGGRIVKARHLNGVSAVSSSPMTVFYHRQADRHFFPCKTHVYCRVSAHFTIGCLHCAPWREILVLVKICSTLKSTDSASRRIRVSLAAFKDVFCFDLHLRYCVACPLNARIRLRCLCCLFGIASLACVRDVLFAPPLPIALS